MKWIEFSVYTTEEGIEAVCGALASVGLEQVSIEESSSQVEAHLRTIAPYWDFADASALAGKNGPCVKAYIADLPEQQAQLHAARGAVARLEGLQTGIDVGTLRVEETRMDDEDWANSWKRYYKPLPIGERLLVCPSWEVDTLSAAQVATRRVLQLDPGMVFGTGAHHTTRMCLELLETVTAPGMTVLDIGCGSGILGIAAQLLGAAHATFVDIDPVAERVVRENSTMNGIPDAAIRVHTGNILADAHLQRAIAGQYDIVVANIVADVILALCPMVRQYMKPGAVFLCSGIIDERAAEVEQALCASGLSQLKKRRAADDPAGGGLETGWVAYCAKG